ncbi:MAG: DUF1329 domain-containing protein [Myxococcota bacterium]
MNLRRAVFVFAAFARVASADPASDPWRVPAPGACASEPPRLLHPVAAKDAPATAAPAPGGAIDFAQAERLRDYVPPEIWAKRERFFYDGMHMEIGPCYRDYAPPEFFQKATRELHGRVTLQADAKLAGALAGLPFPPETIAADDPRAGLKWAWNMAYRYQGAGRFGEHQLSVVNDQGVAEQWRGDHFFVRIAGRADRPGDAYVYPAGISAAWAAGGATKNVSTGKDCVFRQYQNGAGKPDLFEGSSYSRKMERVPPLDEDGALTGCLVDAAIGAGLFTHGDEPPLYDWKVVAVADLLAPINAAKSTWPVDKTRSYGPWGISFADDRWELRRAIELEGKLREGQLDDGTSRFVWYLDLQTLTPLYYAGYRANGDAAGIGYFIHRWSEDRGDYPHWEDDPNRPVRAIDEIGSAFVDWSHQHAVRFDTGNEVAVPESDAKLRHGLSVSSVRLH